ncbi:tumor necrosis factor receptor superfamily member 5-like [Gadus chalcogrammus]|uniref:tumor necrosis factor receptor superfamily member 5-like n=1 Tax=Gadus chalcogrammus TaxID=1042646 RepID=UPI0024C2C7D6|nr:tumor necrosis factor receptor superfamily member 5-like [Gadus chalcogrammus]XP_056450691.1 tumor necrosis factor receptor superfamily member 5-like [Gadus chalcogrammus]XP_056450696.1 tumor necrosis factor receptor superfamily member 5-like [Gadus chalcogrammus]
MFLQILFLICSVCNTHGVASTASPSCASDEYRAGQLCCLACPGGYRVRRDCTATLITLCSKCPDDTFKEGLSGQKQCSACTECVTGQKVKKFCTPTSDAECETRDGFFCRSRVHRDCTATTNSSCSNGPDDTFKEDLSGQKQCSACTECVTGQEVKKFCTPTSDTECEILNGFFCSDSADKDTFSEATLSCQPHTICDSVGGVQMQPGTDSTDSTCIKYVAIAFIIIGCICFIISLVLGALFYRWLKMERDLTELEKQIDEMETPEQRDICYTLGKPLEEKKKTQEQQRKFDELIDRYNEKRESLKTDWTLTELEKEIDEMETPEQENNCYEKANLIRQKKKKTPEQNKKLERLYPRFLDKRKTLALDFLSTEWGYKIRLEETEEPNRRLNGKLIFHMFHFVNESQIIN